MFGCVWDAKKSPRANGPGQKLRKLNTPINFKGPNLEIVLSF